jgi:hypothetical protein
MKTLFLLAALLISIPAFSHSVSLSWTASTDSGVSYNLYRLAGACPTSGTTGFVKINASPISGLTYSDTRIGPGDYCYYATATLNGAESVPSIYAPAGQPLVTALDRLHENLAQSQRGGE